MCYKLEFLILTNKNLHVLLFNHCRYWEDLKHVHYKALWFGGLLVKTCMFVWTIEREILFPCSNWYMICFGSHAFRWFAQIIYYHTFCHRMKSWCNYKLLLILNIYYCGFHLFDWFIIYAHVFKYENIKQNTLYIYNISKWKWKIKPL
jgi:hypothetical protein